MLRWSKTHEVSTLILKAQGAAAGTVPIAILPSIREWLVYDKSAFDFSEDGKKTLYAKGTLRLLSASCPLSEQSSMPHWAKQPIDAALVVSALGSVTALMKELYEAVEESRTPDFKKNHHYLRSRQQPAARPRHLHLVARSRWHQAFDIAVRNTMHPSFVSNGKLVKLFSEVECKDWHKNVAVQIRGHYSRIPRSLIVVQMVMIGKCINACLTRGADKTAWSRAMPYVSPRDLAIFHRGALELRRAVHFYC